MTMSAFAGLIEVANERLLQGGCSQVTEHPLHEYLPESYSLAGLNEDLAQLHTIDPRTRLIAIFASLKDKERVLRESDDLEAAIRLGDFAATTIAPCSSSSLTGELNADNETDEYEETARRSRDLALCGLEVLDICNDEYSGVFSDDTILTLISFTDAYSPERFTENKPYYHPFPRRHPWATPEATELATRVLEKQISKSFTADTLIVRTILQGYLRPLFSKSRPSAITASGRKAEFRNEEDTHQALRDEVETKPWKYVDHRAIAVFQWAVDEANEALMAQQWPLFVPVVLALVDDGATRVRSRGLHIMKEFLTKFPTKTLDDTGLASVFEDAILPTLHFLPTLTPEDESIQLLSPAFDSLIVLVSKLRTKAKSGPNRSHMPCALLLDRIMRDGILSAYFHAKEHVRICQLLFAISNQVIREMGINAVKHLKDLIPMHCEVLTDPFGTAAPELQSLVIQSLRIIFATCWPRLGKGPYQDELLKALVISFMHADDDLKSNAQLKDIKDGLSSIAGQLLVTADDKGDLRNKMITLVKKEPVLADLFKDV